VAPQNTTGHNSTTLTRKKHDCTLARCSFDRSTSATHHKQRTVGFAHRKPLLRSTANFTVTICTCFVPPLVTGWSVSSLPPECTLAETHRSYLPEQSVTIPVVSTWISTKDGGSVVSTFSFCVGCSGSETQHQGWLFPLRRVSGFFSPSRQIAE
jgi:hypothetical protein